MTQAIYQNSVGKQKTQRTVLLAVLVLMMLSSKYAISQTQRHAHGENGNKTQEWEQLLNKAAPEFELKRWINSEPISLKKLRGKTVLIRWWLETCPYCKASAPSLNEFHELYSDKGLVIIGMYHPKPLGRTVQTKQVKEFADAKEFKFPVAIDQDWSVLNSYWPKHIDMSYTSVSFLIDKEGVIRYIHPGGSYSLYNQPYDNPKWGKDYHEIKAKIESLIKEK